MPQFKIEDYDTVHDRLKRFWGDHKNGAIITDVAGLTPDHKSVVVRAQVWFDKADTMPAGVGLAQESQGGNGPNSNCWIENCDTSAVGRALANCGYSGDKRPSREEMQKAGRPAPQPGPFAPRTSAPPRFTDNRPGAGSAGPPTAGPQAGEIGPCGKCQAPVRFAMENGKRERYDANGELHFRTCGSKPTGYESAGGDIESDPFGGN